MIDTFDTFVDDIFAHLDEVKKVHPDIPVYLFGHSMVGEEKERSNTRIVPANHKLSRDFKTLLHLKC